MTFGEQWFGESHTLKTYSWLCAGSTQGSWQFCRSKLGLLCVLQPGKFCLQAPEFYFSEGPRVDTTEAEAETLMGVLLTKSSPCRTIGY